LGCNAIYQLAYALTVAVIHRYSLDDTHLSVTALPLMAAVGGSTTFSEHLSVCDGHEAIALVLCF